MPSLRGPVLLGPDGFLSFLEKPTIDARFNFRGEIPSPLKLIYVDVDSDSIKEFGNFPWNREIFARVIDALFRFGKIRAIGFDFVFSDAGIPNLGHAEAEEGYMALVRSIRDHLSVVVAASYSSGLGILAKKKGFPFLYDRRVNRFDADLPELPGFPVVGPTWGRVGLIDVANDDVRSVPMFAQTQHQTYLAMALQLALMHYGLPESAAEIGTDAIVLRGEKGEAARIPLWMRQLVEVNWFSAWNSDEKLRASVRDVLLNAQLVEEGTPQQKQDALAAFSDYSDAIVLVGPTDPMLKDVSPIPMNEGVVPRVSVHGNLLKTIVGGRYIKRPPVWANVLLIFGLGLGVAALAMAGDRSRSKLGRW
ncbi:MAG: CHASE2 domain-containing protein, partial [Chthoniobacterales bacterium]